MLKKLFTKIESNKTEFTEEEIEKLEQFVEEGFIIKNENYEINSKYRIGVVKVEKNRATLCDLLNEHKNLNLDIEHLNGAYDGDLVLAKRVFNPRSKIKAKIEKVFLNGKTGQILIYVKDKSFYTVKESIKLQFTPKQKLQEGDILLVDNKSFDIVKNLGNISDTTVDEEISLSLYDEDYRLNSKLEVDAKMDDSNKRVDLSKLPFCTIDPNSAKDHDDAIYFDRENSILYVAIADVSYFVKEGSELDKLAFKKSTSAYLPSKVLPMLPNELSEDMCSLKEGVDRYSYVFKIYLDLKNIEVKKSELFEAVINSHRKFSYGRIDRVLEKKFDTFSQNEKEIFDYLLPLYEVTKQYRKKRLKKGYDFRSNEYKLTLKNGEIQSVEIETSSASHQLIEECMLLANIEASKKVNSVGIFRIHEEPPFKAISKLVDDVNALGLKVKLQSDVHSTITHIQQKAKYSSLSEEIDDLIIHAQTQAKYSSKNLGHFGLGFKSYSHFTSPIRRYSDLVLHRILKTKQTPKNIEDICEHISNQERKIDQMVWDFEDRKYARWALKNIKKEVKAKIVDSERGVCVTYGEIAGAKIYLDNYKGQILFSKIKVIIKSSDVISKQITGSVKY
ncbi:RNB domain-containing ribonuclease [Halarcobacter anaerophilus]|uniref:Ribonuclease R n=1 Tax=Halarcobacter anaerophilus TaxID=877500 RepID=A0A4V1LQ17_9BACT|nr:RNB domain-containing ribonuclease [Halarcobacter anaerophilus]QDF30092.1 ribonuclease R [Halarcobacter anaerophilus]RXJ63138.1 ribonuclease R [Halarcobacter anaerophilus]